ncbi:hypothetical protein Dimus_039494 [Dionaea muscipula]
MLQTHHYRRCHHAAAASHHCCHRRHLPSPSSSAAPSPPQAIVNADHHHHRNHHRLMSTPPSSSHAVGPPSSSSTIIARLNQPITVIGGVAFRPPPSMGRARHWLGRQRRQCRRLGSATAAVRGWASCGVLVVADGRLLGGSGGGQQRRQEAEMVWLAIGSVGRDGDAIFRSRVFLMLVKSRPFIYG